MSQLELCALIDHKPSTPKQYFDSAIELDGLMAPLMNPAQETHKPLGVRLAKMLGQYDDQPSSQPWSEIQGLAREILKS